MGTIIFDTVTLTLKFDLLFVTNLTLLITFKELVVEIWYFTWVIIVTRPFSEYQHFVDPVTLTLEFELLFKNFNFAYNFWTVSSGALIFIKSIPCDKAFQFFTLWPWLCRSVTLEFGLLFENLNLVYNFWTVNIRALIFHMNILYDKVFLLVLNLLTLKFDLFKKKLTLIITSKYIIDIRVFILHMSISCDKSFYWYQDIHLCDHVNTLTKIWENKNSMKLQIRREFFCWRQKILLTIIPFLFVSMYLEYFSGSNLLAFPCTVPRKETSEGRSQTGTDVSCRTSISCVIIV